MFYRHKEDFPKKSPMVLKKIKHVRVSIDNRHYWNKAANFGSLSSA